eukprot:11785316-Alexandrium_andersonii.AAC.1
MRALRRPRAAAHARLRDHISGQQVRMRALRKPRAASKMVLASGATSQGGQDGLPTIYDRFGVGCRSVLRSIVVLSAMGWRRWRK